MSSVEFGNMGEYSGMDIEGLINMFTNKSSRDIMSMLNTSNNDSLNNMIDENIFIDRGLVLIIAYGLLVMVALFGNLLVCHVIFSRRRMHTVTNIFIANLAGSDLLLMVLNVPFNIAKTLMKEWMFGKAMCHVMNMSLITSMYASTFTMTIIALDRHRVLLYPFRPRIRKTEGFIVVAVIWLISVFLALPFGIFSETQEVNVYVETLLRCRSHYPSVKFEQLLSVFTLLLQYILPLIVIAVLYGRIVRRIWVSSDVGAVTQIQQAHRSKHKKKSIKMLMIVVVVFALCWMPLNLYHILTDFHPDSETFQYNTSAFFVLHWIAVSSACYNPFIYCWLNEAFRTEIRAMFKCCCENGSNLRSDDRRESISQFESSSRTHCTKIEPNRRADSRISSTSSCTKPNTTPYTNGRLLCDASYFISDLSRISDMTGNGMHNRNNQANKPEDV